jgi:hypothetical protein
LSLPILLRGRHVPLRHRRRLLHELRLRLGVRPPVRKVFYNLTITGLSVFVAFFIGTIEILGLLGAELNLTGGFWSFMGNFDLNKAGFVIVGIFVPHLGRGAVHLALSAASSRNGKPPPRARATR